MKKIISSVLCVAILLATCTMFTQPASALEPDIGEPAVAYFLEIGDQTISTWELKNYTCNSPLGTPIMCDGENIIEFLPMDDYDMDIQRVWVNGDFEHQVYIIADSELRNQNTPSYIELRDFQPVDPSIGTPIMMNVSGTFEALFMPEYAGLDILHVFTADNLELYLITPCADIL